MLQQTDFHAAQGGSPDGKSQATLLVELAQGITLWHPPEHEPYATITNEEHNEHWRLQSDAFQSWLLRRFYEEHGTAPRGPAVQEALSLLEARARFDGKEYPVWLRVASHGDALYLDLANEHWQAVKITADGWKVEDNPPVRFRRPRGMLPLPIPQGCGSLSELWQFVNVTDEEWPLLVGVILSMFRPFGPYPLTNINSEQGSGKTTLSRIIRALIDPNISPLRAEPRNTQDLAIAAENGWCLTFDNLSRLSPWLADALCRLATGGGFATRQLYKDREEETFEATRPVILNGIEDLAVRSDLLDRCVNLSLPSISDDKRKAEADFWRAFEEARPRILGAILDVIVVAVRNLPTTRLPRLPRMADFVLWVTAAESALGWESGTFLRAFETNRQQGHEIALEASSLTDGVMYVGKAGQWEGTATELLSTLTERAGDDHIMRASLPRTPQQLGGELRRIAPNLRAAGVHVDFGSRAHGGRRVIRIKAASPGTATD